MILPYLIQKEFKQFKRNTFMPRIMVMMPVILMLVFPWAATQEVSNINLAIVDNDHSTESARLIGKVSASSYFIPQHAEGTYDDALSMVQKGDADIILTIQKDFGRNLKLNEPSNVMISANAVNGTKGALGASYMTQIIGDFANDIEIDSQSIETQGLKPSLRYLFNPNLDYKKFMIPALFAMMLTMLSGFLPALNIVSEKEKGTIEQINVTPVTRLEFILGKLIPYWIMGFVIVNLAILLAYLAYGFYPAGSILTIYAFALTFILAISSFGLIVSNYSDTMQQAMFVMFFFLLIFMLMSGLFTPVSSMPDWAQTIAAFTPLKYFIDAMRMIFLKGSNVAELTGKFIPLACFAIVGATLAVMSYKKNS